jgi:hypothetical protein
VAADLGLGVDLVEARAVARVPQADLAVGGAAAAGQDVVLERAPRQRLDGGRVPLDAKPRPVLPRLPDVEQVVVAAGRELGALEGPLEAADLLLVALQRRDAVRVGAHVVVVHHGVARAAAQQAGGAPREARHPRRVPPAAPRAGVSARCFGFVRGVKFGGAF